MNKTTKDCRYLNESDRKAWELITAVMRTSTDQKFRPEIRANRIEGDYDEFLHMMFGTAEPRDVTSRKTKTTWVRGGFLESGHVEKDYVLTGPNGKNIKVIAA